MKKSSLSFLWLPQEEIKKQKTKTKPKTKAKTKDNSSIKPRSGRTLRASYWDKSQKLNISWYYLIYFNCETNFSLMHTNALGLHGEILIVKRVTEYFL